MDSVAGVADLLRALNRVGLLCAAALSVAGCSGSAVFNQDTYSGMFSKKVDIFQVPDWAKSSRADTVKLGPSGPVAPDDLVAADGRCAASVETPPPAAAVAAAPPSTAAAAPLPDRLEPAMPAAPTVMGGIALGMSECEVVRRAGQPNDVSIGSADKGERKVVLRYLGGTWPGIYQFRSGRLAVIEAAPAPTRPARPAPKSRKKRAPKTASGIGRVYVQ